MVGDYLNAVWLLTNVVKESGDGLGHTCLIGGRVMFDSCSPGRWGGDRGACWTCFDAEFN